MPSAAAFRLSTYLTLALSCVCLGYAEWDLLPEASVLAAVVAALLAVSFFNEGKYQLDLVMANRVGFAIGLTAAAWMGYQFVNRESLIYTFPWPASLLPYLGPLLMVLMPAKLFRPVHVGDWWAMHGIALAGAGLASAMAEDLTFGLLLALYAAVALWSLAAFYYPRVGGALPPVPGTDPGPAPAVVRSAAGGRRWAVAGWAATALALATPAFYLTPRSESAPWQFIRPRLETGYASEAMIDLTRTGELKVNKEVAFDVTATHPDGTPVLDLDPGQRWRGREFVDYRRGKWTPSGPENHHPLMAPGSRVPLAGAGPYTPPDLGLGQFTLAFTGRPGVADAAVADPVAWAAGGPSPVVSVGGAEPTAWFQTQNGSFRRNGPLATLLRGLKYQQVARRNPPPDEDLGPPFEATAVIRNEPNSLFTRASKMEVPGLKEWTADLLRRLAATDPAVAAALGRGAGGRLDPADYEVVARALAGHLAGSGEYRYTLSLKRPAAGADPIADFLMRGKEGHCQRFAAGLVLMLRAAGIPAQYVLGFKGWDEGEEPGTYLIRQEYAHAWAEVLVTRPAPPDFRFDGEPQPRVWHWLSLDPSPDADAPAGGTTWLAAAQQSGRTFFSDFVVGYNAERREAAVAAAGTWGQTKGWKLAVAPVVLTVAFLLTRPLRRRTRTQRAVARANRTGVGFYDDLAAVLTAAGLPPAPGQTPAEYAASTADRLHGTPAAAAPREIAAAFYQARYAGRPPTPEGATRLAGLVGQVRAALRRG